jgi:prepilin-type N-terminal cleavage/methylation domain-containing protein
VNAPAAACYNKKMKSLKSFSRKNGFTLVEMLVAVAIFSIIIIAFVSILVEVTQVQVQSSSSVAVNQESQFLLQKLQYYIGTASVVNIATSTPTSNLQFYMASSSADPTSITLSGGTVYLQQPIGSSSQALTSNKVSVSNLSFVRNANPPGHDVVSVSFTMAYNSPGALQAFSRLFQTSIVHVSAATFDTGVYASTNNEPLGTGSAAWSPINGVIYYSGGNVGINQASPQEQLEVNGGIRLTPQGSQSTCNSTYRGTLWFVSPGGSTKDALYLCAANASGTVVWEQVY